VTRTPGDPLTTQIAELRAQGLTWKQIGERVGMSESNARRKIVGNKSLGGPPKDAALNRDAVLAFIESLTQRMPHFTGRGGIRDVATLDERRPPDDVMRAWRRWRNGEDHPSLWTLDRMMARHLEIHIDRYFDFCEEHGLNPWEGDKPSWHP
jgi:hypothetical protein